ncbi:MAG TPA: TatD family hydrolase [Nakamurella sp.]
MTGQQHPAVAAKPPAPPPQPLPAPVTDSHTHLDACGYRDRQDVAGAMARAAAVGVTRVVTVADDLESARWVTRAAHWHPDLYAAVALHPTRADTLDEHARREIETLAADPRVVAIGETGLDHYWDAAPHDMQAEAFAWHIDLAKRLGKPVMIHDRDAHDDVLAVLQREGAPERVIFHCFSGDAAMARRCADAGWYLSFAGPVSFRNARDLADAARSVPDDRLLVETDAPFLTPHPHRGKRNEPYALPYTVRALAELRDQDLTELCHRLSRNAQAVYGIAASL